MHFGSLCLKFCITRCSTVEPITVTEFMHNHQSECRILLTLRSDLPIATDCLLAERCWDCGTACLTASMFECCEVYQEASFLKSNPFFSNC
ncbi:hypothetical protein C0J52_16818 [Blattella germanica]|nr:hypothetical protein C0J52_16818 [Blattella germanica]